MQAQGMQQTADETIGQRINRLFQEQDRVTINDLLGVVKTRDELYSHAFDWAIVKLVWRLDRKSQEYRDVQDFARSVGHYRSVLNPAQCISCWGIHSAQLCRSWHVG
jgi:uncharacterized protein (UPF0335 family)